ncbi:hypothetical protein F5148DRAFT_401100 [Russula earlei]|uniref:Uncharacterized protein n=1 Tax=Russula earlei TaxID=71964 RepID=A0ACC0U098_9AGAM|nr:hypothetical protein F5148DRAFT_401100 [Russula earlei]
MSSQNPQQTLGPSTSRLSKSLSTVTGFPSLDEDVRESLQRNFQRGDSVDKIRKNLGHSFIAVHNALSKAGDPKLRDRLKTEPEFEAYVKPGSKGEIQLIELLVKMINNQLNWEELIKCEAFLNPEPEPNVDPLAFATSRAWSSKYKGNLARVLFLTIADYLSRERTCYARLTTIVNSSGTGKSRMVDQLGTEVVVVPICLRMGHEGYPPPDKEIRDWLLVGKTDRVTVRKKLYGLAHSLLVVTLSKLEAIEREGHQESQEPKSRKQNKKSVQERHEMLALAFHEHMTQGQSHPTDDYRETFYNNVIKLANKFTETGQNVKDNGERDGRYVSPRLGGLLEAGENLCRFIDENQILDSKEGLRRPLIILAFDEAHILTDRPDEQNDWNLFTELRRILREIKDLPIFSLFLSTASRFHKFSPEIRFDPSARAREPTNRPLNPISEISFDDIAHPAIMDTRTIHDVVTTDWISHLGRPLFGSYLDSLPEDVRNEVRVIDYAKQKLLCGPTVLDDNPNGVLACLSVRFALTFNMDVSARNVSFAQVERHMLLCIAATVGLEKLVTMAGSEPLLAEAAYDLMKETRMNAVRHLANHSDLECVDRGRRGELVATLLIMQAFDAARGIHKNRWVTVVDFMKALLPESNYEALLRSLPTSWPDTYNEQMTFKGIFKDYGLWFNHVIKVESKQMISKKHLWKFVTRGAMILCATNQEGIDIVLPVFHTGRKLGPDSMTAVVIQVKNARDHKTTLNESLFDAMDSVVKSAIFSTSNDSESTNQVPSKRKPTGPAGPSTPKKAKGNVTPAPEVVTPKLANENMKPVIRLVFALASPKSAVVFRERPLIKNDFDGFTAFDIWLAGLDRETFNQLQDADTEPYKILLERSLMPHDAFKLVDDPNAGKETKKARVTRRQMMAPLILPDDNCNDIHLRS